MDAVIIMSIHQPSSEIWEMLDRLLLLSKGMVMYEGYTADVLSAFETAGDKCPARYNPADFLISLVNNDFNKEIDLSKYKKSFLEWRDGNADNHGEEKQNGFADKQGQEKQNGFADKQGEEGDEGRRGMARQKTSGRAVAELNEKLLALEGERANFFTHLFSLLWRNLANSLLNPGVFGIRFAMYVMLALCVGALFFDLEDNKNSAGIS
jgi:ABC-type multidrug transport system ATPase subunit